ncbi:transposase [Bacillus alveayuensis]|jgi:hypothetical protein|uniref:transposase n=1 Tax=Aeribacillus alveayuensis TaxID=279215 RepID=UPI0006967CF0|nr:transposase [Bacillus alveayuensis]
MSNQMITTENYNTQMIFPLDVKEEKTPVKRKLAPTFQPYDNRQIQVILDLEALIPEHHVARVVDEMVEAVPDELLFSHYKSGGRSSYHPNLIFSFLMELMYKNRHANTKKTSKTRKTGPISSKMIVLFA